MIGLSAAPGGRAGPGALAFLCSLLAASCAEGQSPDTTVTTPRGVLTSTCPGVPMVYSKRHGVIAFGCDDGSMPIARFGARTRPIADVFALDMMAVQDTDDRLTALAFRPAQPDDQEASLLRIDLITGAVSKTALQGAADVTSLEVNPDGDCLMASHSDGAAPPRLPGYAITAHKLGADRDIARALSRPPSINVIVTGNEASTVGHLNGGFSRCFIDAQGRPALLLTRLRPLGSEGVESTLELHVAGVEPKPVHQARSQWRLMWRNAGNRVALIDGLTGRLGLIDLAQDQPAPQWVDVEGHWIDYDPSDGSGVILRDPGPPSGTGMEARGPLVRVRCATDGVMPVCRDEELISPNATEVYASGIGVPGAGVVLQYTEVTVSPGSTLHTPRLRWLF